MPLTLLSFVLGAAAFFIFDGWIDWVIISFQIPVLMWVVLVLAQNHRTLRRAAYIEKWWEMPPIDLSAVDYTLPETTPLSVMVYEDQGTRRAPPQEEKLVKQPPSKFIKKKNDHLTLEEISEMTPEQREEHKEEIFAFVQKRYHEYRVEEILGKFGWKKTEDGWK